MRKLCDILYKVPIRGIYGSTDIEIKDVASNSNIVLKGGCFIALKGTKVDGHDHIEHAISEGAVAIIHMKAPAQMQEGITYVEVEDTTIAAGLIAHQFYGDPSSKMQVIGVTGTNGKTTVATLLYQLFSGLGYRCGLISTVRYMVCDQELTSTHTTPDAINLALLMSIMRAAECTHIFMECSSHAIHQHRISGVHFRGAVFTNITHDHLDYHQTFDAYIRVKKSFFDGLGTQAFAISNLDDKRGMVMLQNTAADKHFYSLRSPADIKGKILDNSLTGLHMLINDQEVNFRLIGSFNAYNLMAVYGAAICLGEDRQEVLTVLSGLTGAAGRFEQVVSPGGVIGIVDYAHTPDALQNVLTAIQGIRKGYEKVITVIGCGGDRDRSKRPMMGTVACELSDRVVFTSDNPRTEDPDIILQDMAQSLSAEQRSKLLTIADRREAIRTAVALASKDDIVLLAGKGHEKYQEIKGVRIPFDDKAILEECFQSR